MELISEDIFKKYVRELFEKYQEKVLEMH